MLEANPHTWPQWIPCPETEVKTLFGCLVAMTEEIKGVPWKVWGLVTAIAAPVVLGAFAMGQSVGDHKILKTQLDSGLQQARLELEQVRIKTEFAYEHAINYKKFDVDELLKRVSILERFSDKNALKLDHLLQSNLKIEGLVEKHLENMTARKR